jgi:hypothetical protein
MSELITLNALIADRTYRIKLEPENETAVRNTCKIINDKIVEFKTSLAGKDTQDYLAMVLLWYATNLKASETTTVPTDTVSSEFLENINKKLENLINRI